MSHEKLKSMLVESEKKIPHLYLDPGGLVTVGIGHMIPEVDAAQKLSFVVRDNGSPALESHVASDYENVGKQEKGKVASYYAQFTVLDMPDPAIEDLLNADIAVAEEGVRARFAGYETYPEPAQDAILDMAFNLGVTGLVSKFPKLKASAEAGDWAACAQECHRLGISEDRNEKTKQLFKSAEGLKEV